MAILISQDSAHESFMARALQLAQSATDVGEVPVGALIVHDDKIIAEAFNTRETDGNPLHHAEIKVLQMAAAHLQNWRLTDCVLYVTLEPCPMCLGALLQARVTCVVFGAADTKRQPHDYFPSLACSLQSPKTISANNHTLQVVGGVLAAEAVQLLQQFFQKKRNLP